MSNLKSMLGENKQTISVRGKEISIYPIKVRNLPVVLDKIHLFQDLQSGNLLSVIGKNFGEVVELFSSMANVEKEFVEDLELSEVVDLVEAVIEINKEGFFLIIKKLENLTEKKQVKEMNGQKPSSSSSKKVTVSKPLRATA